eukprot:m51a1_g748 putative transcription factor iih subunit (747) ;mRNA; f:515138-517959
MKRSDGWGQQWGGRDTPPPKRGRWGQQDISTPQPQGPGHLPPYQVNWPDVVVLSEAERERRPMWITPDGRIYLESFSPLYREAYDFLIAVANPISRPKYVQEYEMNAYSLFGAVSVGLTADEIVQGLRDLSKTELPEQVESFVRSSTAEYGKVKIVLRNSKFWLSGYAVPVMKTLVTDAELRECLVDPHGCDTALLAPPSAVLPAAGSAASAQSMQGDDEEEKIAPAYYFEILPGRVAIVRKRCAELKWPALDEYDFRNDESTPSINMDLKPTTAVRSYQQKSLQKMLGNGRAQSGLIVLACGAGKTLVGITATASIKKPTLCLCTNSFSCKQWADQYMFFSTLPESQISLFTSQSKDVRDPATTSLTVTTYNMLTYRGHRSEKTNKIMQSIGGRDWGLLVMDEVHVVPADTFKNVLEVVRAHCKLGLTATLLREDDKIGDLNFLIGPKLYEANWLDLVSAGYLARVQCVEVWCKMPSDWYETYLAKEDRSLRNILYVMNPTKIQMTQALVNFHSERGDKILIFCDYTWPLEMYANWFHIPFIYGKTSEAERREWLARFKTDPNVKVLMLSRVGDNSIDLPEASVLIQISAMYGSRRQEAQRLGRILRPKPKCSDEFNAYFYSLVSTDTSEMYYAAKRQQFLVDQGYSFKIVEDLLQEIPVGKPGTEILFGDTKNQQNLLAQVVERSQSAEDGGLGMDDSLGWADEEEDDGADAAPQMHVQVRRGAGSMGDLSGAGAWSYSEVKRT